MNVLLDYLLIAATLAASLRLFHSAHPPPAGAEARDARGVPTLARNEVPGMEREPAEDDATPLQRTLKRICVASRYRSIKFFIEGARSAYETILEGFSGGELEPVQFLLSPDVYEDFAQAIADRKARGETVELTFIGLRAAEIIGAELANGRASIDVRFDADVISVTRDREGRNVAGHPAMVVSMTELWTFERELRAAEPIWVLTATEPDDDIR